MVTRRNFLKLSLLLPIFANECFAKTSNALAEYDTSTTETQISADLQYPIRFPISFSENSPQKQPIPRPIIEKPIDNPRPRKPNSKGHFLPGRNK